MKILTVNAGSSSLKFSMFELPESKELVNGLFERIGTGNGEYTIKFNGQKIKREKDFKNHFEAIEVLKEELITNNIIANLDEIDGIGHRVVHGGSTYSQSTLIDEKLIDKIEELSSLAPLHNPANIIGIKAFKELLPNVPSVAVFDTAFHQTMAETEYLYPVPYEWYEKYGVRKYGFHGTSHRFIDKAISKYLKRDDLKVISCHIGQGGSICAINSHKSIDTSMGFTPLAGIMMGTRSGDIDPGIIPYIASTTGETLDEIMNDLNKKSGYLGVSGISSDSRDIEECSAEGNLRCQLVEEIAARKIANYIARYNNLLDGADVITLTAGLGEKSSATRAQIADNLKSLGIKIDEQRNKAFSEFALISADDSNIPVYVVPTNEELMIAEDTYEIIK